MQSRPFHRSASLVMALAAINAKFTPGSFEARNAAAELGGYVSRGKAGKTPHRSGHAHMRAVRAARKIHNVKKRRAA